MTSPFLYFPGHALSLAELSAARLDGDLIEIDEAYTPTDTVETSAMRAGSLSCLLGETLAATHLSAAWIHGAGLTCPTRHTVQRAVPRRIHGVIHHRLHYRDLCVPEADLLRVGGVKVTSVARTVADLARVDDPDHASALARFAVMRPASVLEGAAWLHHAGTVPHKRRALRVLQSLVAVEEITKR